MPRANAVRRGLVLGCGGTVGGAWTVGTLAWVADHLGWDPRGAEVIVGTSSGSSIAAMLGAGVRVEEMVAAQRNDPCARDSVRTFFTEPPGSLPPLPRTRPTSVRFTLAAARERRPLAALSGLLPTGRAVPGFLDPLAADLVSGDGWVQHRATWLIGVDLRTARRAAFGSPGAPPISLRDAMRASWAIPGWYRPVHVESEQYADGGIMSPASADLVAPMGLDEVVLIAPMASRPRAHPPGLAGRAEGLLRARMSGILDTEVATLEAAGTRVLRFHPDAEDLREMGANFMNDRRRIPALDLALSKEHT